MIKHQMFIAMALLAGVAIGYFVKDEPAAAEEPPKAEKAVNRSVADKGDAARVKALRHRIAELERLLAEKDGKSAVAISNAVAEAAKVRLPEPPRMNWRERMEEMKKNDPERYNETTNRMAQWRRDRAAQARGKIGFLSSIDTSRMSAEAKKTHVALQDLIAKREEIEERLQDEDLSDEDRAELRHELGDSYRELMRLNGEERTILFDEVAKNLGLEGEDVKDFTSAVQEMIRATDGGWGGFHVIGPRDGRGGPGGR